MILYMAGHGSGDRGGISGAASRGTAVVAKSDLRKRRWERLSSFFFLMGFLRSIK